MVSNLSPSVLKQISPNPGASEQAIKNLLYELGTSLPADYLDFLRYSNGGIGRGPNLFVILDQVEEIPEFNRNYEADDELSGLVVVGGDGCGNLLGIDTRAGVPERMEFVWFDAICIRWDDVPYRVHSWAALLEYLDEYYENCLRSSG